MEMSPLKLAVAAAFAAAIGFGGVSLASAQEDPTTSTTTPEATEDDRSADDENCPHDDEADADASTTSA